MKIIALALCIQTILGQYKITFGPKNNYFDDGSVGNPISRTIYGTNRSDLIICYTDTDAGDNAGLCELGLIDVASQKITFGKEIQFDAPAVDTYETQLVGPNGVQPNIIVGYTSANQSSEGIGKLAVGVYDLGLNSMSFGTPVTFNVGDNDQTNVVELERTDGYFVVCYSVGARDNRGTGCRIGQYDPKGLTAKFSGRQFNVPSFGTTDGMAVSRALNNGTFLACYSTDGASIPAVGYCVLGLIPELDSKGLAATIEYSRPTEFNGEGGTDQVQILRLYSNTTDDPNALVCYVSINDGACSYLVIDMDNEYNPIQVMSRNQFDAFDKIDQPSAIIIPPGAINGNREPVLMMCYVDVNRNEDKETAGCMFGEISQTGYYIRFAGPVSNFEFDGADRLDAMYLGGNNMLVCYVDGSEGTQNKAPCLFGVIS